MKFTETKAVKFASKTLQTGVEVICDGGRQFVSEREDAAYEEGKQVQRNKDIRRAIEAFIELKQDDSEIFDLLSRHFGVDSIQEVQRQIKSARCHLQIVKLRELCVADGMRPSEFRIYADEHQLEQKLDADSKLLYLSVEKLKSAIEKK